MTTTATKGPGGVVRWVDTPPATPAPKGRHLKPCGTTAAYARHLRKGEPTCEPCMEANTEQKKWHAERRALLDQITRLERQIIGRASRGWICELDGCWNPALTECLACEWAARKQPVEYVAEEAA